jgi:hypothetical protein
MKSSATAPVQAGTQDRSYAMQYLAGIAPTPSLPPSGTLVNDPAALEVSVSVSSTQSDDGGDGMDLREASGAESDKAPTRLRADAPAFVPKKEAQSGRGAKLGTPIDPIRRSGPPAAAPGPATRASASVRGVPRKGTLPKPPCTQAVPPSAWPPFWQPAPTAVLFSHGTYEVRRSVWQPFWEPAPLYLP